MQRLATALPAVRLPRVPVRAVIAVALAAGLLGGGWMWFRDSGLVRINAVSVIGLSTNEGSEVRAALTAVARNMTTLHVDRKALEQTVSRFPSVAGLRIQTDFPHGIAIEVTERKPIAIAELGGEYMAVGSGGRLMRGVQIDRTLPVLHVTHIDGDRLDEPAALGAISLLAAAPPVLRRRVARVQFAGKGLMVNLRNGPAVYFGSRSRPVAKWMAAARVLAEPSAAGAVYLDVRVPDRVAAGGLGTLPQDLADPLAQGTQGQTVDPQPTP